MAAAALEARGRADVGRVLLGAQLAHGIGVGRKLVQVRAELPSRSRRVPQGGRAAPADAADIVVPRHGCTSSRRRR